MPQRQKAAASTTIIQVQRTRHAIIPSPGSSALKRIRTLVKSIDTTLPITAMRLAGNGRLRGARPPPLMPIVRKAANIALTAMRRRVTTAVIAPVTTVVKRLATMLTSLNLVNPILTGLVGGDSGTVTTLNTWIQVGTFGTRFDGVVQVAASSASRHMVYDVRIAYDYTVATPYVAVESTGLYAAGTPCLGSVCITDLGSYASTHIVYVQVTAAGNTQIAVNARSYGTNGSIFGAFTVAVQMYAGTPTGYTVTPAAGLNCTAVAASTLECGTLSAASTVTADGAIISNERLKSGTGWADGIYLPSAAYTRTVTTGGSNTGAQVGPFAVSSSSFTSLETIAYIQFLVQGRAQVSTGYTKIIPYVKSGSTYYGASGSQPHYVLAYNANGVYSGMFAGYFAIPANSSCSLYITTEEWSSVYSYSLSSFKVNFVA